MAYNALTHRPNVQPTEQVMSLIAPATCWHFDAWMMRDGTGALFVRVETRSGGRDILTEHTYRYENGVLRYCLLIPADAQPVTLQDRSEWPNFEELNSIHWDKIVPMLNRVPAGYRSRSVCLHYIRAPSLEPFEGTEVNMHRYGEK